MTDNHGQDLVDGLSRTPACIWRAVVTVVECISWVGDIVAEISNQAFSDIRWETDVSLISSVRRPHGS